MPLFSVVIPVYNSEQYVTQALDSVALQDFSDLEVVVVDDGSTDASSQVVIKWARQHPEIPLNLISQVNKGIGGARNTGIFNAHGEFIAFLDSDDYWLPGKLKRIAFLLKEHRIDLICHNEYLERSNGDKKTLYHGPYTTYEDLLFKGNCISTSATCVRRTKALEVKGFSENLEFNGVEDYDFWLRLARTGCRIHFTPEILGVYRLHGQGISSKVEYHARNSLNLLNAHFDQWSRRSAYYRYLMRRRRSQIYNSCGRRLLFLKKRKEALIYLWRAFREDPFYWKNYAAFLLYLLEIIKK